MVSSPSLLNAEPAAVKISPTLLAEFILSRRNIQIELLQRVSVFSRSAFWFLVFRSASVSVGFGFGWLRSRDSNTYPSRVKPYPRRPVKLAMRMNERTNERTNALRCRRAKQIGPQLQLAGLK